MLNIFIQTENHLVIKRESYINRYTFIKLIEKLKLKFFIIKLQVTRLIKLNKILYKIMQILIIHCIS